jgi:hypothetical protein
MYWAAVLMVPGFEMGGGKARGCREYVIWILGPFHARIEISDNRGAPGRLEAVCGCW